MAPTAWASAVQLARSGVLGLGEAGAQLEPRLGLLAELGQGQGAVGPRVGGDEGLQLRLLQLGADARLDQHRLAGQVGSGVAGE